MLLDSTPTEEEFERLQSRAKEVCKKLKDVPVEPVAIEFAGSPKSGKTTNIDIIHHFFKRMGFKVWAPTEGASKRTPYNLKKNLVAFNTWSLTYAIQELLVSYHNVDKHDLIILDRGPFDSLAWMGLLREKGELTEEDFKVFRDFALHHTWLDTIARVYLFTCNPQVSLDREHQVKLTKKGGIAMNEPMLKRLLERYHNLPMELKKYPVKTVDTSESNTPIKSAYPITEDICSVFDGHLEKFPRPTLIR